MIYKPSNLNSNLALTLGYLSPALNNSAQSLIPAINWRDTTHFDSEDDYCTGCSNVSHCQQQQSYSDHVHPNDHTNLLLRLNLTFQQYEKNF